MNSNGNRGLHGDYDEPERRGQAGWLTAIGPVGVVLMACSAIGTMNIKVRHEIEAFATAHADSTQWSLAQADIELLALHNALLKAQETSDSSLHEMRRRLDVFYKRVKALMTSAPYAQLRETGTTLAELGQVQAFLSSADPVIDGVVPYLRQSLPELAAQAEKLHPAVRTVSLSGMKVFSGKAAPQRPGVVNLLGFVSSITLALIDALLLFLALLILINRQDSKCSS